MLMTEFEKRVGLTTQMAIILGTFGAVMLLIRIMLAVPNYKMGISIATRDLDRLEKKFEKSK